MAFDLENGYQPRTFEEILEAFVLEVNEQFGTTYDSTTIVGTEFYRFFYAGAQLVMQAEAYTAQITAKMTDYIRTANEQINLPKSTIDGFIQGLKTDLGLDSTIKDIVLEAEAGNMFLVVDTDASDHAIGNAEITSYANLVSGDDDSISVGDITFTAQPGAVTPGDATFRAATGNNETAASLAAQINAHATASLLVSAVADDAVVNLTAINGGAVGNAIALAYTDNDTNIGATVSGAFLTGGVDSEFQQDIIDRMHDWLTAALYYNGNQAGSKVALNGQTFDYKFALPTDVDILVRITVTASANSTSPVLNENQIRDIFDANLLALYRLGLDFEPEKYLEISRDLPFASDILLEYSEDGGTVWLVDPRSMAYNEKINLTAPATISVI